MSDFDSPWKEAIDSFFEAFVAFFFPQAHADIDWKRGYEFLDKELQQIIKEAESGRRVVDKLVKVWLKNGAEEWLLIHIEIQTQPEADFPFRVFVYNYRLIDRYNRKVVSLVVLADDSPDWRPDSFRYALWGFELAMRFPTIKLLDYAAKSDELAKHANPFAVVVLAHLKALETRRNPDDRSVWKMTLVRGLYERAWSGDEIRKLFRFIDWVMDLPAELSESFWHDFREYEEKKHMPFITSVERIGMEKGHKNGLIEAIAMDVESKFPTQAAEIMNEIQAIDGLDALRAALKAVRTAQTPDDFRSALRSGSKPSKQ